MAHALNLIQVEVRKLILVSKSYSVQVVADQVFFIFGFLLLTGLFELATDGEYSLEARWASLIGYLTWRVAGGLMVGIAGSIAEDAQWGTLEQVWLSGSRLILILLARSASLILYYTFRVLIIGAIILPLLQMPIIFPLSALPGALIIYLLTLSSAIGLALLIAGLHLIYKNVNAITFPLATMLLFFTGAITPLQNMPILYTISRFLPLSIGIGLLRNLLVNGQTFLEVISTLAFLGLLINGTVYLVAGWVVLKWGKRKALLHGSLAHY